MGSSERESVPPAAKTLFEKGFWIPKNSQKNISYLSLPCKGTVKRALPSFGPLREGAPAKQVGENASPNHDAVYTM